MKYKDTPASFTPYRHCDQSTVNLPRRWSQLSYAGEKRVPEGIDVFGGTWPLFLLKRSGNGVLSNLEGAPRTLIPPKEAELNVRQGGYGRFLTPEGHPIDFAINEPDTINFDQELIVVQQTLKNLTPAQIAIARYWGEGPPTKQWTPIIDRLIDTYNFSPLRAARVLAAVQSALNDTLVVVWYYKYLWDIPRPNQLDQNLATLLCTPKFPSYPSGHAAIAGCAQVVLSYFFESEAARLEELAEEAAISRLYAGVHFPSDNNQGLRLGRQIGSIIVNFLSRQNDAAQTMVDIPVIQYLNATLPPPPYTQAIPYDRSMVCTSLTLPDSSCNTGHSAESEDHTAKKKTKHSNSWLEFMHE